MLRIYLPLRRLVKYMSYRSLRYLIETEVQQLKLKLKAMLVPVLLPIPSIYDVIQ